MVALRNFSLAFLVITLGAALGYRSNLQLRPSFVSSLSKGHKRSNFLQDTIKLRSIIDTQAEDVSSPRTPKSDNVFLRIVEETRDYLLQFRNAEFRKRFGQDFSDILKSAYKNIREGEVGKRGEELFAAQAVLVTIIIAGVPIFITFFIKLVGIAATTGGFYFICRGVWDLKQNLTPFVSPISGNQLVTSGIYGSIRHPLYTGLICICLGASIFSDTVDKAVLTAFLAFLLDKKATREEELLQEMHPMTYGIYVQNTKKLIPTIY